MAAIPIQLPPPVFLFRMSIFTYIFSKHRNVVAYWFEIQQNKRCIGQFIRNVSDSEAHTVVSSIVKCGFTLVRIPYVSIIVL